MKDEITLNEFINETKAWDNKNGTWSVEITLKSMIKSIMTVDNCNSEYDAKERAYLFLLDRICNK